MASLEHLGQERPGLVANPRISPQSGGPRIGTGRPFRITKRLLNLAQGYERRSPFGFRALGDGAAQQLGGSPVVVGSKLVLTDALAAKVTERPIGLGLGQNRS